MPLEIELSDQAELDLIEIWNFIGERNEPAADRLLRRIWELLTTLAEHAEMGRARPDLSSDIRSFPATENYGLFYTRNDGVLRLLRVMRFSQDITSDLFEP